MEKQSNLVNAPRIGNENNSLFSNVQVNIATPVNFQSTSCTLSDQLGHFGGIHADVGDLPEGYSCMTAYSDLPADIDSGQFSIFELGVFTQLVGLKFVFFNGVMFHGGSPPRPQREDVVIPAWAYRVVYIAYPQAAVYLALGVYMIGALRGQDFLGRALEPATEDAREEDREEFRSEAGKLHFSLGPDVLNNPEAVSQRGWLTHPNFVQDGHSIMSVISVMTFVTRCLYLFVVFVLRQLPDGYEVTVDADKFFSAFTYESGDGRKSVPPWSLAPSMRDNDATSRRQAAAKEWTTFSRSRTDLIPFSILRKQTREDLVKKGKRAARVFAVLASPEDPDAIAASGRPSSSYYQPQLPTRHVGVASDSSKKRKRTVHVAEPSPKPSDKRGSGSSSDTDDTDESYRHPSRAGDHGSPNEETLDAGVDAQPPEEYDGVTHPAGFVDSQPDAGFQAWLAAERRGSSGVREVRRDVIDAAMAQYDSTCAISVEPGVLLHPWYNPLNRLRLRSSSDAEYADERAHLPDLANEIFSEGGLLRDIWESYSQNRDACEESVPGSPKAMGASVASALKSMSSGPNTSSPIDMTCISALSEAWTSVQRAWGRASEADISRRCVLVAIMSHSAALWARMETMATHLSRPGLGQSGLQGPLVEVAAVLWNMVRNGEISRTVDASRIHGRAQDKQIVLSLSYGRRSPSSTLERQQIVYSSLLTTIAELVGVRDTPTARLSSWLIWAVLGISGFDGLYHVEVWRAWQRPRTRCMARRQMSQPTLESLLPYVLGVYERAVLSTYPGSLLVELADGAGEEGEVEQARAVRSFMEGASRPTCSATQPAGVLPVDVPSRAGVARQVLFLLANLIGAHINDFGQCSDTFDNFEISGVATAVTSAERALLEKAASHVDLYLPFRAFGPSYLRMLALFHGHPTDVMPSTTGLRNVALTRVITFGSGFLLSGRQSLCLSLTEWLNGVEVAKQSPQAKQASFFVCDRVYGQNFNRSLDEAAPIWAACEWPEEIARSRHFVTFWRALHHGVGKTRRYKVPNVGPLIALLIAGDYYMNGHLDEPSTEDMGLMIHKVNAGGVRGLAHLGFLSQDEADSRGRYRLDLVQDAFDRYYRWSLACIPAEDRTRWRWDVITAENHLCKDSRLKDYTDAVTERE
ncbi:unnamed protein product [Peniophora sp. CBMAI 1063]|nr:unnamed protein product [Peniophora sp. CBMAI 1063]